MTSRKPPPDPSVPATDASAPNPPRRGAAEPTVDLEEAGRAWLGDPSDAAGSQPPREWQAGGPSPNPKGRPPKRWKGPITLKMSVKEEVSVGGVPVKLTRRELLDRLVQQKAQKEGGRWTKLWIARQERDRMLVERAAAKPDPIQERQERYQAEVAAYEKFKKVRLRAMDEVFPGYAHAYRRLEDLRALDFEGDEPRPAKWLERDDSS